MATSSTSDSVSIGIDSADSNESNDTDESTRETSVVSLLDRLKSPKLSELSRKRKVLTNPPVGKKRSSGRRCFNDPKVQPSQRIKEFPEEELTASAGRLFCKACRETLCLKRSTIFNHVKSTKHI